MLPNGNANGNGRNGYVYKPVIDAPYAMMPESSTNGHVLECPSDYEPAPILDIPLSAPGPAWRNDFPLFTHNLSWVDGDGCSHSLTLRSDNLLELFADLRLLKGMIRASKQKAAVANPGASEGQTQPEQVICKIHGVEMERRVSKRTGGHYHCHRLAGNDLCFGREKK